MKPHALPSITGSLSLIADTANGSLAGVSRLRDIADWTGREYEWVWEGLTIRDICDVFDATQRAGYDYPTGWAADDPKGFAAAFRGVRWASWRKRVLGGING